MRILTPCLIMLGTLVWPGMALAIDFISGGWSTSFDYGQECSMLGADSSINGGVDCQDIRDDFINWNGGTVSQGGEYSSAVLAANNSNGDGGNGARFWLNDGQNNGTPSAKIVLPQQESEFWLRWYERYELGFSIYIVKHKVISIIVWHGPSNRIFRDKSLLVSGIPSHHTFPF